MYAQHELADPQAWFGQLTNERPNKRRYSEFYSGLDRSVKDWTLVINSEKFQEWALERDQNSGTRIVDMLYELWDDFKREQFAALLGLYISSNANGHRPKKVERKVVSGRYELLSKLGTGGFGDVFLTWSWETKTLYALKAIKPEFLGDSDVLGRFKKEANCWVKCVAHPNIVRAFFLDEIDGTFYITLEYIASDGDGSSLESRVGRNFDDRQLVVWFIQVVDGLRFAYESGIKAHRDVKPANILVDQNGIAKISDFGLAGISRNVSERSSGLRNGGLLDTQRGSVFGSLFYMAPEQFKDATQCDERSDIYSLGMTFYRLASRGRLPFDVVVGGGQIWAQMRRLHESAKPNAISSNIWPVIKRCIAKNPSERYPNMLSLREELLGAALALGCDIPDASPAEEDYWSIGDKAITLLRLEKYEEALAAFERCLSIFPWEGRSIFNKGVCLSKMGRYREALDCYELLPDKCSALINSSYCYRELGDDVSAEKAAVRATEVDSKDPLAWITLGFMMHRKGDFRAVIKLLDRAKAISPDDPTIHFNASLAWLKLGDAEALEKSFAQFLSVSRADDERRVFAADQLALLQR